jgi:hypothetical protein
MKRLQGKGRKIHFVFFCLHKNSSIYGLLERYKFKGILMTTQTWNGDESFDDSG